jgi:hypothetical protein
MIYSEFTEARIKGSIYHELSHWIRDTLHNNNIHKKLSDFHYSGDSSPKNIQKILYHGEETEYTTDYEIDAQIHAIKQLKRNYRSDWDSLNFSDMLDLNASLKHITHALKGNNLNRWMRKIKSRMYREGLLGKKMR